MSSEENKVNQDRAWNLAGDLLQDLSPDDPEDTDKWGLVREEIAAIILVGMQAETVVNWLRPQRDKALADLAEAMCANKHLFECNNRLVVPGLAESRLALLREENKQLREAMAVVDKVKQYPDAEPAARARRVIGHLKNERDIARKSILKDIGDMKP